MKILIVEDEVELLNTAKEYLLTEGYICEEAPTYRQAFEKVNVFEYDCIVVDIGLPDGNGLSIVQELKSKLSNTGIIIISARNALEDRLDGLNIGADDYLTKPFHLSELNARIKSILRRRKFNGSKEITYNEIRILPDGLQVYVNNQEVSLTKKEYDLLIFFISNENRILTKESIVEHLWGDYFEVVTNYDFIQTHISNLKRKLTDLGASDYIKSVYRLGYKFCNDEAPQ
jgi:DNA-binding response OmpR family regulator